MTPHQPLTKLVYLDAWLGPTLGLAATAQKRLIASASENRH